MKQVSAEPLPTFMGNQFLTKQVEQECGFSLVAHSSSKRDPTRARGFILHILVSVTVFSEPSNAKHLSLVLRSLEFFKLLFNFLNKSSISIKATFWFPVKWATGKLNFPIIFYSNLDGKQIENFTLLPCVWSSPPCNLIVATTSSGFYLYFYFSYSRSFFSYHLIASFL